MDEEQRQAFMASRAESLMAEIEYLARLPQQTNEVPLSQLLKPKHGSMSAIKSKQTTNTMRQKQGIKCHEPAPSAWAISPTPSLNEILRRGNSNEAQTLYSGPADLAAGLPSQSSDSGSSPPTPSTCCPEANQQSQDASPKIPLAPTPQPTLPPPVELPFSRKRGWPADGCRRPASSGLFRRPEAKAPRGETLPREDDSDEEHERRDREAAVSLLSLSPNNSPMMTTGLAGLSMTRAVSLLDSEDLQQLDREGVTAMLPGGSPALQPCFSPPMPSGCFMPSPLIRGGPIMSSGVLLVPRRRAAATSDLPATNVTSAFWGASSRGTSR